MNLQSLILVALLTCFSSFSNAAKNSDRENHSVPQATAAESELSFRAIPYLDKAFIDTNPMDKKDGIPVGELGIDSGNKDQIVQLAQEIAEGQYGNFDSLLISHKGKLLFESYYRRGRVDLPHPQASATKSYTGLVLGRAIQLGYLSMADLDRPLVSFLKQLDPSKFIEGAENVTLYQALTMTTGLRVNNDNRNKIKEKQSELTGQKDVQALFELSEPITEKSKAFSYSPGPGLVMQVIDVVVPGAAKDFIKNEFLNKLGITKYRWRTAPSGLPESGWKVSLTSRDMAKIGLLAINKGRWNGEQLIPEAFINKAISRVNSAGNAEIYGGGKDVSNQGYGYFWWSADLKYDDKRYFSASAQGGGGQYIIVIKELDLMVVVTAHDNDNKTLQIVAERLLPAFIQDPIKTSNVQHNDSYKPTVLQGPYLGQTPPSAIPKVFAPGYVSTEHKDHSGFFTPDMTEFYFTRKDKDDGKWSLIVYKSVENRWRESVVGPRVGRPIISADGKTMHLGKHYMVRTETGWSEVKSLGPMFDREDWGIMRLSASAKGTYIFDDYKSNDVIRISRLKDGKRQAPKLLDKQINTGKWNAHPFIAADESYLIWDGERESGYGGSDLYISYRQQNGAWSQAINLGDKINTSAGEAGASITPDGKYLLFNRSVGPKNVDIFWVDAQIIENLRPKP